MTVYFEAEQFTLYHGNCLDILKLIPEDTFDMIFADPPYFLSNGSFTCHNGEMVSVSKGQWDIGGSEEENFEFHKTWIALCKRLLKPNGTIWVSGTYHSIYQCGVALKMNNFHILNDISWFKPNASPNLSCRFFTASHENLIWAKKNKMAKHTFNYSDMKDRNWQPDFIKKPNQQMRSVWAINPPLSWEKTRGKHPTQKPVELLKRIILASTNENDLILDPFTGSSTTGIAATIYKRKFVGIDMEQNYLQLSVERFKRLKSGNNNYEKFSNISR
jgi:site-specific DNA-methyltransferase (adenine-specific)